MLKQEEAKEVKKVSAEELAEQDRLARHLDTQQEGLGLVVVPAGAAELFE